MSQGSEPQGTPKSPHRWFQFSLRTALGALVVLGVGFAWLSDRAKLQEQLARERAENEGLRAARDYVDQTASPNPWAFGDSINVSGWPYVPKGEPDEATVEHLPEYISGEPVFLFSRGGGSGYGGSSGSTIFFDSTLRAGTLGTMLTEHWSSSPVKCVRDVDPKDAGAVPALVKLLDDKDATIRARAACTLARLGPNAKRAAPALVKRLKDADSVVRYHAAYALGRMHDTGPDVVEALSEAMDDDSSPIAAFAAQMLHRLIPKVDIAPRLIELLDHSDAETRRRTVAVLATDGSAIVPRSPNAAAAIPKLKKLCADPDPTTCKQAMTAIEHLGSPAEAHAVLGEIVRAGPDAEKPGGKDVWTVASVLWNRLDREVRSSAREKP